MLIRSLLPSLGGTVSVFVLAAAGYLWAQESNRTANQQNSQETAPRAQMQQEIRGDVPLYKIEVVAREIPAINYFHHSGKTTIGFQGTALLPNAKGTAEVQSGTGRTSITADLEGLTPASAFGPEYLTYVLWAITPEGRPVNLGEVIPAGSKDKSRMSVTTNLQAFGLIITAEPYFAVTMPSDVVVMQNYVLPKTAGVLEQVNAHYTLLPRGAYAESAGRHVVLHPIRPDKQTPLELAEARNAMQIAEAAGAETYAADTLSTARVALENAQQLDTKKSKRAESITFAREAVQSAEDARIITIRKIKAEDEAKEIKARQDAEEAAKQAQAAAEQQAAQRAVAQAEAAKARAEQEEAEQKAALERQQAEQAKLQAQQASQQAQQARERLRQQLSQVLETRETARGLIMNMSDVLFSFNKYTLKPEALEKLARVSGILLAYPDLKIQVEGYTDNIGSDQYNEKLSEERADSVRDFLVKESVPGADVTAEGLGESDPIADNSTAAGRAQNRRVQLVVSGAAIGMQGNSPAPGSQSHSAAPSSQAAPPSDQSRQ